MAKERGSDRAPPRIYIIGGCALASWVPVAIVLAAGSAIKNAAQRHR